METTDKELEKGWGKKADISLENVDIAYPNSVVALNVCIDDFKG